LPAFNGMSNSKVTDLDLRDDNTVYASTYGRGVFSGEFKLDPDGDEDGDGVLNGEDNCPNTANTDQADIDNNGIGDVCQDTDNDFILDINDNCPNNANTDQADSDGNGIGDACQDTDGDTILDINDNCVNIANVDQTDTNGNGFGDVCDSSYEDPSNFELEVISETCDGENNGIININLNELYVTYTVTLVGNGVDLTQSISSNSFSFENIAVGAYTLCISVDGRNFEQCYEINIDPSEPLNAIFSMANNSEAGSTVTSVSVNRGTAPFIVSFNNEVIRVTTENLFEVETNGSGLLEIKSSKVCEGILSRVIENNGVLKLTASPNPVIDILKVMMPNSDKAAIPVQVYDISGKMLLNISLAVKSSYYIEVPFNTLSKGIYFVKLGLDEAEVLKILKK